MTPGVRPGRPILVHLTTTDMSLDWLLGPQLSAFAAAGYDGVRTWHDLEVVRTKTKVHDAHDPDA